MEGFSRRILLRFKKASRFKAFWGFKDLGVSGRMGLRVFQGVAKFRAMWGLGFRVLVGLGLAVLQARSRRSPNLYTSSEAMLAVDGRPNVSIS